MRNYNFQKWFSLGLCVVPSDGASSTWALTDAQAVELGADCSTWVWSWWKDWNKPPGYEYGGIEVNSAVLRNLGK